MIDAKKKAKRWSYIVGERGRNRARAFAHSVTGRLFLEFYEPTRLASELRQGMPRELTRITLGTLFDNYLNEVSPGKSESKRKHDGRCADLSLRAFGRDREARSLSRREWDRFIAERRTGVLRHTSAQKA